MSPKITLLCGGVGGARAALALYENFPHDSLTIVVNTGDDFSYMGLEIWPDWDTVVYHLAGLEESERGWGRSDEGLRAMEEFQRLQAPHWFHLGDRDLALHVFRTWSLQQGWKRAQLSEQVCRAFQIDCRVLPFSEQSLETKILLQDGERLDFQEWFVARQGQPKVRRILNDDVESKTLTEGVAQSLHGADLLLIAPSNPFLSLGPMLAHPQWAGLLKKSTMPKIAVSPLIGGKAIKGPLDRLIETLSPHQGQEAMAHYWAPWVDALLLPEDECLKLEGAPLPLLPCPTLLNSSGGRSEFCSRLTEIWRAL